MTGCRASWQCDRPQPDTATKHCTSFLHTTVSSQRKHMMSLSPPSYPNSPQNSVCELQWRHSKINKWRPTIHLFTSACLRSFAFTSAPKLCMFTQIWLHHRGSHSPVFAVCLVYHRVYLVQGFYGSVLRVYHACISSLYTCEFAMASWEWRRPNPYALFTCNILKTNRSFGRDWYLT